MRRGRLTGVLAGVESASPALDRANLIYFYRQGLTRPVFPVREAFPFTRAADVSQVLSRG